MNKFIYGGVLIVLLVIGLIFVFLPGEGYNEGFELQRENPLSVEFGQESYRVHFENLLDFQQYEIDTERGDIFKGIRLKVLLGTLNIPLEEIDRVITTSIDAYSVALSAEEVLAEDNVYLVYEINGKPLSPMEEGGSGPFRILIREDPFRQRWNKNVEVLEVR